MNNRLLMVSFAIPTSLLIYKLS